MSMKKDINFIKFVAPKVRQKENEMKFYSHERKIQKAQERLRMQYTAPPEEPPQTPIHRKLGIFGW